MQGPFFAKNDPLHFCSLPRALYVGDLNLSIQ